MPPVAELSLAVKADFPIFERRFDGRELVYLDSAATSQKPRAVIDAVAEHLALHNANVHRGVYALAQEADAAYEGARGRVAAFTGAAQRGTIFTKNATEAINLVAYSWGRANVGAGDAVLLTQMEHHANLVPWQVLCRERGAQLRYLEVDERGELSLEQLQRELERGDVRLVGVRARVQRARHHQPRRRDDRARARRGRGVADRRRAGRAAHARGRGRDRRGLLRVDRPQGARPDRRGRAARPRGAARARWSRSSPAAT